VNKWYEKVDTTNGGTWADIEINGYHLSLLYRNSGHCSVYVDDMDIADGGATCLDHAKNKALHAFESYLESHVRPILNAIEKTKKVEEY